MFPATRAAALLTTTCSLLIAACSSTPPVTTGVTPPSAPAGNVAVRKTPVVAGRPARMYIWTGFNPRDCKPITPKFAVAQPPGKGDVAFRPNQMTLIQQSSSGACIGKTLPGTGIYYTARQGQTGPDRFSVSATMPNGSTMTRSFQFTIAD